MVDIVQRSVGHHILFRAELLLVIGQDGEVDALGQRSRGAVQRSPATLSDADIHIVLLTYGGNIPDIDRDIAFGHGEPVHIEAEVFDQAGFGAGDHDLGHIAVIRVRQEADHFTVLGGGADQQLRRAVAAAGELDGVGFGVWVYRGGIHPADGRTGGQLREKLAVIGGKDCGRQHGDDHAQRQGECQCFLFHLVFLPVICLEYLS